MAGPWNLDYFLAPKESGYDVPKTLLYGVLLIVAVYLIYRALKRLKVKIDQRLAVAAAPYVVFGSCLRVLKDAGVVRSYLFQTPSIYVFVFSIFSIVLLLAMVLNRKFKIEYYKTMFVVGIFMLPFLFSQLVYVNIQAALFVLLLLLPWIAFFKFVRWSTSNKIVALLHMFDATTTFTAMSFFGYYEQHIVPTFFINIFGPISFIILKLVTIVGVLYVIDMFSKDVDKENKEFPLYLKIIIGILGAGTGTRDLISLAAGV